MDIAVGPFNTEPKNIAHVYNNLVNQEEVSSFFKKAYDLHYSNLDLNMYKHVSPSSFQEVLSKNENARCFLAIEIENKNSKKHILGSVVNAASLGRIGIGIGFNKESFKAFLRVINYLSFLREVDKNTYHTGNFLVLSVDQMNELLESI